MARHPAEAGIRRSHARRYSSFKFGLDIALAEVRHQLFPALGASLGEGLAGRPPRGILNRIGWHAQERRNGCRKLLPQIGSEVGIGGFEFGAEPSGFLLDAAQLGSLSGEQGQRDLVRRRADDSVMLEEARSRLTKLGLKFRQDLLTGFRL